MPFPRDENINHSFVEDRFKELRKKVLDFSGRNRLINFNHGRGQDYIRVIDEVPDQLLDKLVNSSMIFRPLPDIEEEPEDEKNNPDFQSMLAELLSTDGEYLESVNQLSAEDLNYEAQIRKAERALRDRIRDKFGMEPIKDESVDQYLKQLAKSHNLNPSWELGYEVKGDAHQDNEIQTLLDPDRFIRRIRNLNTKVKNITRETGINVLQISFGFLEWVETNQKKRLSPLLLLPLTLEEKKDRERAVSL